MPWRQVSGESFCSWSKVWNLLCCSCLTVKNLHLHLNAVQDWIITIPVSPLNQCLSFLRSDFVSVILILLFQVIFPTQVGFNSFLQLKIHLWIILLEQCVGAREASGLRTAFSSTSYIQPEVFLSPVWCSITTGRVQVDGDQASADDLDGEHQDGKTQYM